MNTSLFDEKEINEMRKGKGGAFGTSEVQRQKREIDDLQPNDDTNTLGMLLVPQGKSPSPVVRLGACPVLIRLSPEVFSAPFQFSLVIPAPCHTFIARSLCREGDECWMVGGIGGGGRHLFLDNEHFEGEPTN